MKEKIVRLRTNMGSWQRGERRRRSWKWLEVDGGDGSNQLSWRRKPQSVQQPACTSHTASLRSSPSSSSNSFTHYSHTNIFNLQFLFLIFSAPPSKTKQKKTENNYERGTRKTSLDCMSLRNRRSRRRRALGLSMFVVVISEDQSIIDKKLYCREDRRRDMEHGGNYCCSIYIF